MDGMRPNAMMQTAKTRTTISAPTIRHKAPPAKAARNSLLSMNGAHALSNTPGRSMRLALAPAVTYQGR